MNTDKIYAEQIANEYARKGATKVTQLKKLDAKAKKPATIFAYTFGIVGALVLGVGMCLSMKIIGEGTAWMVGLGIVVGIVGIAMVGANYPIYKALLKKGKEKYASDILALAKEISEESEGE